MNLRHVAQLPAYVDLLRTDPAEVNALFKDLLINVTSFFREPAAWQILQERVIRRLVAEKDADLHRLVVCVDRQASCWHRDLRSGRRRVTRRPLNPEAQRTSTGHRARAC